MTHEVWVEQFSAYLDGELEPARAEAVEQHLRGCAACADVLEELRDLVIRAASLQDGQPSHDLWPPIAARIGAGKVAPLRIRRAPRRASLMAAGIAILAFGAGSVWVGTRIARSPAPSMATVETGGPTPAAAVNTAPADRMEVTTAAAVSDLERVLAEHGSSLDSVTVAVLRRNLAIIDSAIAQAEAALQNDPADAYLNIHLARTMRRKIDLLRRAAVLSQAST